MAPRAEEVVSLRCRRSRSPSSLVRSLSSLVSSSPPRGSIITPLRLCTAPPSTPCATSLCSASAAAAESLALPVSTADESTPSAARRRARHGGEEADVGARRGGVGAAAAAVLRPLLGIFVICLFSCSACRLWCRGSRSDGGSDDDDGNDLLPRLAPPQDSLQVVEQRLRPARRARQVFFRGSDVGDGLEAGAHERGRGRRGGRRAAVATAPRPRSLRSLLLRWWWRWWK